MEAGRRWSDCTKRAIEVVADGDVKINSNEALVEVCYGKETARGTPAGVCVFQDLVTRPDLSARHCGSTSKRIPSRH